MIANWEIISEKEKQPKRITMLKNLAFTPDNDDLFKLTEKIRDPKELVLNPRFAGIGFDEKGIVVTNGNYLLFIQKKQKPLGTLVRIAPGNDTFDMTYFEKVEGLTDTYKVTSADKNLHPEIVQYERIVPMGPYESTATLDIMQLHTYTTVALQYANKYTKLIIFAYTDKNGKQQKIGLNGTYLLNLLEAMVRLGYSKLDVCITGGHKPLIMLPVGGKPLENHTALVMPYMPNSSNENDWPYGSRDIDFDKQFTSIYNFSTGQITTPNNDGATKYTPTLSVDDVTLLTKAIDKNNVLPILEFVCVKKGTAYTSNLEHFLFIENCGLPDGMYSVTPNGTWLNVTTTEINPDNFVKVPDTNFKIAASIDIAAHRSQIIAATYCTGNDELRPNMNGVFFEIVDKELSITATDAHKLYTQTVPVQKFVQDTEFIQPNPTYLRTLYQRFNNVTISTSSNHVKHDFGNGITYISRQIDGRYPLYKEVIPREAIYEVTLNLADLASAIKQALPWYKLKEDILSHVFIKPYASKLLIEQTHKDDGLLQEKTIAEVTPITLNQPISAPNKGFLIMPVLGDEKPGDENKNTIYFSPHVFKYILDAYGTTGTVTAFFSTPNRATILLPNQPVKARQINHQRGKNATAPKAVELSNLDLDLEAEALELELQLLQL